MFEGGCRGEMDLVEVDAIIRGISLIDYGSMSWIPDSRVHVEMTREEEEKQDFTMSRGQPRRTRRKRSKKQNRVVGPFVDDR